MGAVTEDVARRVIARIGTAVAQHAAKVEPTLKGDGTLQLFKKVRGKLVTCMIRLNYKLDRRWVTARGAVDTLAHEVLTYERDCNLNGIPAQVRGLMDELLD